MGAAIYHKMYFVALWRNKKRAQILFRINSRTFREILLEARPLDFDPLISELALYHYDGF